MMTFINDDHIAWHHHFIGRSMKSGMNNLYAKIVRKERRAKKKMPPSAYRVAQEIKFKHKMSQAFTQTHKHTHKRKSIHIHGTTCYPNELVTRFC